MPTSTTEDGTSSAQRDSPFSGLPNKLVRAANGIDYAHRDTGAAASGGVPLVLFQHFRGNLDNWDPALIAALAAARQAGQEAMQRMYARTENRTRRQPGRPVKRNMTRYARGGSPITRSSSGSAA